MKKAIPLFLAVIMATVSCGDKKNDPKPDDPSGLEAKALPATIVMTSAGETRTYTITYLENTAKIDKIDEKDGMTETYLYEGDLITKEYEGATSDSYDSYEYDGSGKLTKMKSYRGGENTDITEFSSLTSTKTKVIFKELNNNIWETGLLVEFNYNTKGDLIGADLSGNNSTEQITLTYDDKNSPFMNVLGWGKIRYTGGAPLGDNVGFKDIMGIRNNPIKLMGKVDMFGGNVEVNYTYEFKDSKNPKFPTKIIGTKKIGTASETFTAEITYK